MLETVILTFYHYVLNKDISVNYQATNLKLEICIHVKRYMLGTVSQRNYRGDKLTEISHPTDTSVRTRTKIPIFVIQN